MPRLCVIHTPRCGYSRLNKSSCSLDSSNFDRQASITRIVQDFGWQTLEKRQADTWFGCCTFPAYIQYSNRISGYCHSMTSRQFCTTRDYYINVYSFFPLATVQSNALPHLLHACRALMPSRWQFAGCSIHALSP